MIVNGLPEKDLDDFDCSKKSPETIITKFTRLLHSSSACNYICTAGAILLLFMIILICQSHVKALLMWLSYQDPVLVIFLFIVLFTLVSFPFLWGYLLLVVSSSFLFGMLHGFLIVVLSANVGIAVAHYSMRAFNKKYPICNLEKSELAQAVLRVIGGPQALKIVFLCRLSPIPFGLQNTIFALSSVSPKIFHVVSFLGLLPAQLLASYLGSTLRSMEDVMSDHSHATTGIVILCIQVICGIVLLLYIVHKARLELKKALLLQQMETSTSDLSSISIS